MQSIWSSPNPILFGRGASGAVGEHLRRAGCAKALVVYDAGVKAAGLADRILDNIRAAGIETVCFDGVLPDPPDWSVEQAGALGVSEKADCVVGVGGGSSLDTAKGAKLLIANPPPLRQYFGREGVVTKPSVPLIVIPTTAGTGSECTPGGVITDTERGIKTNIAGIGCAVTLGIVDPDLTLGLPPAITASTGMDALCHAVESYTSARANSFSEVAGREAIRLVARHLARACEDGSDAEAREGMMLAATLGGIAMSGALCHLSHDIGRSLGAKFHVPHGNGCAACLPQVLERVAPVMPEKLRFFAECFGLALPGEAGAEEIGRTAREAALSLMRRVKLPNMKALGLKKEELIAVVPDEVVMQCEMAAKIGIVTAPLPVTRELIADIVARAFDEN
ncbi:MAG: iron-containing alcohol dehydrogenase [Clostridiales Family XIII bacterium]|jgi:alcohol dehydrogenase class IV|nr:iron-containing alcohol dehydrogenase [Clostridiales Family XIII bacterium]